MNFLGAAAAGYGIDQILEFVMNSFPHIGKRIKQAKRLGHDAKDVINFFKGMKKEELTQLDRKLSQEPNVEFANPLISGQNETLQSSAQTQFPELGKNIAKTAIGAGAAYGASKLIPKAKNLLTPFLNSNSPADAVASEAPGPAKPPETIDIAASPINNNAPPEAPKSEYVQPELFKEPFQTTKNDLNLPNKTTKTGDLSSPNEKKSLKDALSKFKEKKKGSKLLEEAQRDFESQYGSLNPQSPNISLDANSSTQLPEMFKQLGSSVTDKLYEGIFDSLKKNKDTFSGVKDPLIAKAKPFYDKGLIKSPQDIRKLVEGKFGQESMPTESIGSLALTPQGDLGEIESIKNGIATIDSNGNKKTRKLSEIETSPLPAKDLADLHADLIAGIEKHTGQQVSRNVNWAGYDPETRQLAYIPHNSDKLYTYDNIPEEDVKQLTNFLTQRKSSGDNFIGAWQSGTKSPIGAAMYAMIQKLQKERGGKGKEYSGKFQSVYSALEPAISASKKKKKEQEDRERKAKRAQKK
jgi:hypothetical protein